MKRIFMFLVLGLPLQAWAWGAVGHRTVALIAEAGLSPAAKSAVASLLGKDSIADVASWADDLRPSGKYRQTVWYHFEKIPDDVHYLDNLKALPDWQLKKGGIVGAILLADHILRDPKANHDDQTVALKFLVHFVGDIHQPLHTGRPEDNGAVKIKVNWMGEDMSLHHVWDGGMMMTGHVDFLSNAKSVADNAAAYTSWLMAHKPAANVSTAMDVEGWLNESLAMRRPSYDTLYVKDQAAYQSLHLPEIDNRIYVAGLRLSALLNDIYGGASTPKPELDLWSSIEKIAGSMFTFVSFKP